MTHEPLDTEKLFRFFELMKHYKDDPERKEVFLNLAYAVYVILHNYFESKSRPVPELPKEEG